MWCLGVSARRWVGPVVWGIAFAGSAGRWIAAAWACCGPVAVPAGGEWRCVAGVYRFHGGGWARGRLPAGSGCRGRTVGGYSAASRWCVPWWPLVGWLKGVFGVYRIHGGTIVCWGAAAAGAAGCGGGACVGVDRVFGGGVSCVVLGGSSWWSVVVVPGGWSWALRFLGRCGACGVGLAGGGGARVCGLACLPSAPPVAPSSACPLLLSFRWLVWLCFFWGGGGGGLAGVLCVVVVVCRCQLPVPRAPVRGGLTAGGWQQWWRGACVGGCGSWLVSGWRGREWACVWVWLVCVGVGYVCAEGAVGWAGARWAMQWVEEMLVTPTGGVL